MIVGIPTEIKNNEHRVGIVPAGVHALRSDGHEVLVQEGAGAGSGIADGDYRDAGASIVSEAAEIWQRSEMIIKVKEPLPEEYSLIQDGQTLFTYFHFAASRELTDAMLESGVICVAYETIENAKGHLPLLTPMSEVAGRMSIQEGAKYLERPMMGRGILLGGVPGVAPADVTVLGGGVVGYNAAKVAAGLGAHVTILDIDLERLRYLDDIMPANVTTLFSDAYSIRECARQADLLIGAVLLPGAAAPKLVNRDVIQQMKPGSVIVDVAVDQGGCVETCRPTTHAEPTYIVDGVVHYCVANMPGAVGRTSTYALTNVTLPYARLIARDGIAAAVRDGDPGLRRGVNIAHGKVCLRAVAETFDMQTHKPEEVLG